MNAWFRNQITSLYNVVSAPVAATRDALTKRLQNVRKTVDLLYNKAKEKIGYGQKATPKLKKLVEEQAYVGVEDIKHLYPKERDFTSEEATKDIQYL